MSQRYGDMQPGPNRQDADKALSSYEEAKRRSDERMGRVARSTQRLSEQQGSSRDWEQASSSSRAPRQSAATQTPMRGSAVPRDTATRNAAATRNSATASKSPSAAPRSARTRQESSGGRNRYAGYGNTERSRAPRHGERAEREETASYGRQLSQQGQRGSAWQTQQPAKDRSLISRFTRPDGGGEQQSRQLPNPFSRGKDQQGYHEQQLQGHSRSSGNYRARPATFSRSAPAPNVSLNGLLVRGIICIVLLIVVIFSFTRIGPTVAALGEAQAAVTEQQAQLDQLNQSNTDLQSKLDSMKATIDKYNELASSST